MSYIDDVKDKRQSQADKQQSAMLMRSVMQGNQQKPSIILTDSTDLGEHISLLGDKITDILEAVVDDKSSSEQIDRITDLIEDFREISSSLEQASQRHSIQITKAMKELKDVISRQKPIVVPAPAVSLTEKAVDFKPLISKIEQLMKPAPAKVVKADINLNDFRAQDIDNEGVMQYIGFTGLGDIWYILLNDTSSSSIRYHFGKGNYYDGWEQRHNHDYNVLNEAINEIRT